MATIDPLVYKGPYLEQEDGSLSYLGPDLQPRPLRGGNATVPNTLAIVPQTFVNECVSLVNANILAIVSGHITSNGIAVVPSDAPIRPAQAFVDAMIPTLLNSQWSLDNKGITTLNDGFAAMLSSLLSAFGNYIDLRGNALNVESVDLVIETLVTTGVQNGTLDVSIGTNAPPTPARMGIDGVRLLDFRPTHRVPNNAVHIDNTQSGIDIYYDVGNLADSHVDSNQIYLGLDDSPTAVQIAAKCAALFSTVNIDPGCVFVATDNLNGTVTVTLSCNRPSITAGDFLPLGQSTSTTGAPTVTDTADGVYFINDSNIDALIANGWTVICNEYVNRKGSGPTEIVTYSP